MRTILYVSYLVGLLALNWAIAQPIGVSKSEVTDSRLAVSPDGTRWFAAWGTGDGALWFANSTDGAQSWGSPQRLPGTSGTYNHFVGQFSIQPDLRLYGVFVRMDDVSSPRFAVSDDLGESWSEAVLLGGGNLPRNQGLALVQKDNRLEVFYHDYDWHGYRADSSDGGATWQVEKYPGEESAGDPLQGFASGAAGQPQNSVFPRIRNNALEIIFRRGDQFQVSRLPYEKVDLARSSAVTQWKDDFLVTFCDNGKVIVASCHPETIADLPVKEIPELPGRAFAAVIGATENALHLVVLTENETLYQLWSLTSEDGGATWTVPKLCYESTTALAAPSLATTANSAGCAISEGGVMHFIPLAGSNATQSELVENCFPNGNLDDFDGDLPVGWSVDTWLPDPTPESWGALEPGADGAGKCLISRAGNPIASVTFQSPAIPVTASTSYVYEFAYASTLTKPLELTISIRNSDRKVIRTETVLLPETQNQWTTYFRELMIPAHAVELSFTLQRKWSDGEFRLDDFSLRPGRLKNFGAEYQLQLPPGVKNIYPIFSWMGPAYWGHFGENAARFDTDNVYAEYAKCNFTKGYEARFGVQRQSHIPAEDEALAALNADDTIWFFHGYDEPNSGMFPDLAKTAERIRTHAPNHELWINLLPTYGFANLEEYTRHVEEYIKVVKPKFLTYDFYGLGGAFPNYYAAIFANLEIVRNLCRQYGVEWGVIHLVVSHGPQRSPGDAELRWQAYTSLAYGTRAIGWFTYLTEVEYGNWNWQDAVLGRDGNRTRHYTMLQRLNRELLIIGDQLLNLDSTGVYHTAPLPPETQDAANAQLVSLGDGEWVLGEFAAKDDAGSRYFLLANRRFDAAQTVEVTLKHGTRLERLSATDGTWQEVPLVAKKATITLAAGDGVLFKVD